MTILIVILLFASAGLITFSIRLTVKMFSVIVSDKPPEERSADIIKIRNKMLCCYAGAAGLIAAAALVKMFLM